MVVLKFFDVVLKFELSRARCLNFPKNSASVLIRMVLIIGDCVYVLNHFSLTYQKGKKKFLIFGQNFVGFGYSDYCLE